MEREQDGVQDNNGAPMGTGQTKMGRQQKGFRNKVREKTADVVNRKQPMGVPQSMAPMGQQSMPQNDLASIIMGGQQQQPQPQDAPQARAFGQGLGGYQGQGNMLGFNTALDYDNESAKNSMKNVFGQIASRYKAAPSSLAAVMNDPDFKQFFPNARIVEGGAGDKIDFGGMTDPHSGASVGVVDVGGAFDPINDSGAGWTWQDLANAEQQFMPLSPAQGIYDIAQNQFGTEGGQQMQEQLGQLDDNALMDLLRAIMSEGQQYV
jgi:hypothetical protein